jgi:hypothetical protein
MSATIVFSYSLFAIVIRVCLSPEKIKGTGSALSAETTISLTGNVTACLRSDHDTDHLVVLASSLFKCCRTPELSLILLVKQSVLFLVRIGEFLEESLPDQFGNCEICTPAGFANCLDGAIVGRVNECQVKSGCHNFNLLFVLFFDFGFCFSYLVRHWGNQPPSKPQLWQTKIPF